MEIQNINGMYTARDKQSNTRAVGRTFVRAIVLCLELIQSKRTRRAPHFIGDNSHKRVINH